MGARAVSFVCESYCFIIIYSTVDPVESVKSKRAVYFDRF